MVTRSEDYSNFVHRLFNNGNLGLEACRNVTFQVTGDCTLRCSYCYEHHKSCGAMSLKPGSGSSITSLIFTRTALATSSTRVPRASFWISSAVSLFWRRS